MPLGCLGTEAAVDGYDSNLSFIAQDFTGPSESRCVAQPISVTAARRSPPPWSIEEANAACFIVKDHNGHAPAYVYLQNEPGRRAAAKPQTKEEPRRINFAKLLELLWRTPKPM
jgi:hypothetical protein